MRSAANHQSGSGKSRCEILTGFEPVSVSIGNGEGVDDPYQPQGLGK